MKSRKGAKALALLLGACLIAASCGDDDDGGSAGGTDTTEVVGADTSATETSADAEESTTTEAGDTSEPAEGGAGGVIGYAQEQEFDTYNNATSGGNALKNSVVLNEVLPETHYFGADGNLALDTELMVSAEVTVEDPQTIEYVVVPEAVWEDGDPIDCDDFQLFWIAGKGAYNKTNPDGTDQLDPTTQEPLPLFDVAGTTGYALIDTLECSEDGKTITTTYSAPFADWKGLFNLLMPAHILEAEGGVADIGAAIEAAEGGDVADLTTAAAFWDTGWILNPGELKPEIMPSGAEFKIDSWEAGTSLTLVPNPNYWGTPVSPESVVIRQIPQEGQVQALVNEEVNIIEPQPSIDVKAQLDAASGVEVQVGNGFTYEHLDFNYRNPDMANLEIRTAFAMCVPRQQIIDQLITPLDPEAALQNSRWNQNWEDDYVDTSGGAYETPDIAGAAAILEEQSKTGLQVRIGHNLPNQRRTDTVSLIKASCDQAGFEIIDAGSETFFDDGFELDTGEGWDVALFAWIGSSLVSGSSAAFVTNGGNNNGSYSSAEVDALLPQIESEVDVEAQGELVTELDTILWTDLATIPLFVHPDFIASTEGMTNVIYNPTQAAASWNAAEWALPA